MSDLSFERSRRDLHDTWEEGIVTKPQVYLQ